MKALGHPIGSFGLAAALAGCATVKSYERLQQPKNEILRTHINGTIFRVQRSSDLPNAFGRADLFGGKIDRGFIELRYLGLAPDGRLLLRLTEIDTTSNETTMSRYGGGSVNVDSSTTYSPYGSWTTARGVYIPPREGSTEMLPPNTVEFLFDTRENPLILGNLSVTFMDPSNYGTAYVLARGSLPTVPRASTIQPERRTTQLSGQRVTGPAGASTQATNEYRVPVSDGRQHLTIRKGLTEVEVSALLGRPQWEARFAQTTRWDYGRFSVIFDQGRVSRVVFIQP